MRSNSFSNRRLAFMSALLAGGVISAPAFAQSDGAPAAAEDEGSGLQEIIVTAEKRAVNIQKVPIAVTAISGDALRDRRITDASALSALVPNVSFNAAVGETRISIRGITFDNLSAQGAEARVAYHQDGVYISRSGNIAGTFFDVDRIEVLRGPQGTLFGRNAIAGAVNLITRDPTDEFSGYLQADFGNYDAIVAEGALSGPITEGVTFRIAGRSQDRDGYGKNLVTGTDIDDLHQRDIRAKLKIEPSDGVKIVLSADYSHDKENAGYYYAGPAYANSFAPPAFVAGSIQGPGRLPSLNNLRAITSSSDPLTEREYYGFGANATIRLTDELSLVSITAYRHNREYLRTDNDYTDLNLLDDSEFGSVSKQFSEELRIQGDYDWGNFLVGAYYFRERYLAASQNRLNDIFFGPVDFLEDGGRYGANLKTDSYAGFAQATVNVTDQLHLTLGARYTKDKKARENAYFQFAAFVFQSPILSNCRKPCDGAVNVAPANFQPYVKKSWNNFSPKITIAYDINPDLNVYATYSKGFKSGGFQAGLDNAGAAVGLAGNGFNPEKITNYEAGFKGDFFDRRLRINAAGFYYDYKNLQVFKVLGQGFGAVLTNAAASKLYGAEVEITALPMTGLQLNLSGSLMHTEFTEYTTFDVNGLPVNLKGNRLPSAPEYTLNAGIQYTVPSRLGEFTIRGETQTLSKIYFDQYNNPAAASKAYTLVNFFLNWENNDRNLFGGIYMRNVGNTFRFAGAQVGNMFFGGPVQSNFIAPRTYGARLGVKF